MRIPDEMREVVSGYSTTNPHFSVRPDWLALHHEDILDPDLPIVDAHHHLWDRAESRYFLFDFLEDVNSGHDIRSSVFMECGAMYRQSGPPELKPIGETEFANGAAAMSASGNYGNCQVCTGIISHADLRLGDGLHPVLEAHIRAGGGRFRGVRQIAAWHPDPAARGSLANPPPDLLSQPAFRSGLEALRQHDLSFDTFAYHTQLRDIAALARHCETVPIIINHTGGAIGIGPYAGKRAEVFADWRGGILELARTSNVHVKLGGLGMRVFGFEFGSQARPPSSVGLAAAWAPYFDTCIEAFGVHRCMFESNFPVDKGSCSYAVLWNAFKRITAGASPSEKAALFYETATRVYRLLEASEPT
jgi:predicted TIM-barrel fold metal-dependent hydrolase